MPRIPRKRPSSLKGRLDLQSKKLEQTEKMNELIYQGLSAFQASPNPAEYVSDDAQGTAGARRADSQRAFPRSIRPALMAFKLKQHETLKNQIDRAKVDVEKNTALLRQQQALREQQGMGLDVRKDVREEKELTSRVGLQGAQTQHALAQTAREKQAKGLDLNKRRAGCAQ